MYTLCVCIYIYILDYFFRHNSVFGVCLLPLLFLSLCLTYLVNQPEPILILSQLGFQFPC